MSIQHHRRGGMGTVYRCGKLKGGPGGIFCPCCSDYGRVEKAKPATRRHYRRVTKILTKLETRRETDE
jgi:hypothetical protein